MKYNSPANNNDDAVAIAATVPTGPIFQKPSIFVTGTSQITPALRNIVTICYTQPLLIDPLAGGNPVNAINESEQKITITNYPNPFNTNTQIEYTLPEEAIVTLKIYDMGGREVMNIVNEKKSAGLHRHIFSAADLPKGIYTCIINIRSAKGEHVLQRKMMLQ
jgi:Secretion system C-terminal sorting domain